MLFISDWTSLLFYLNVYQFLLSGMNHDHYKLHTIASNLRKSGNSLRHEKASIHQFLSLQQYVTNNITVRPVCHISTQPWKLTNL
jgi:hypothetical protein